ncbi:protein C19orf12 homolog [Gouania willdenowi]|uniref:Protein C19orf12 homolog n=1 Tax=Gouania willdenowi TaxID=441366 RepID=A0A8C5N8V8_GOUWI|nr:protein C19orf12 homolog [Gouania willdenowi]
MYCVFLSDRFSVNNTFNVKVKLKYRQHRERNDFPLTMAPRVDDVMRLCCELSAHEQISVAVKCSAKGAAVAGGAAFAGGLLAGPMGIAVGGLCGGVLGAWLTSGQFKPLPQILIELNPTQQNQLHNQVMGVLGNLDWTDAAQLVTLVMASSSLHEQVLSTLLGYVKDQLHAEVRYKD